jgi:hypothetical protein
MGKKEKTVDALVEDFQAMIKLVPKLGSFIKVHNEILEGYQKYRKNGGAAISGIEKYAGIKKQDAAPAVKAKKTTVKPESKTDKPETMAAEKTVVVKKTKKKAKK